MEPSKIDDGDDDSIMENLNMGPPNFVRNFNVDSEFNRVFTSNCSGTSNDQQSTENAEFANDPNSVAG